jgi:hypothetical protein
MTKAEYISRNIDHIKMDIKLGIVSSTILRHLEIYCRFDYYRKSGLPVNESILNAGDDFKVSETTVFKIKKQMEAVI